MKAIFVILLVAVLACSSTKPGTGTPAPGNKIDTLSTTYYVVLTNGSIAASAPDSAGTFPNSIQTMYNSIIQGQANIKKITIVQTTTTVK
jgi:hypothetical protein